MPIVAGDIEWRLSTKTGAAGDSTASTGAESLGKWCSTSLVPGTLHGLFDEISGAENAASTVDYRCAFVVNTHATLTLQDAAVWLDGGDPAGGAVVTIAVDSTAASPVDDTTAQALEASTETAPGAPITALSYSAPAAYGSGVAIGDLGPGECRAVWIRRAANNSGAVNGEALTFAVTGATAG